MLLFYQRAYSLVVKQRSPKPPSQVRVLVGPLQWESAENKRVAGYTEDMRPRVLRYTTTALLTVLLVTPLITHAQIPFFGPVIFPEIQRCAAGWGAVLIVINNIIKLLLTIAIVFVAPLTIAYAGFLFVVNPTSAGDIEKAKKILTNTVVGITIALASWLIVDAVMAVFYKTDNETLTQAWWQLVSSGGAEKCLPIAATQRPSDRTAVSDEVIPTPPREGADGAFTYQAGIQAQAGHASAALNALLSCMASYVPANVGEISSISDSMIVSGSKTFAQCAAGECQHSANSCHYGGKSCVGKSYGVDFGDEGNASILRDAARQCGADYTGFEGDHLHVSVGAACGCN